ncbi:MAG TPA: hypothetical protein VMM79_13615 [Longimicrobiales bacterium]|nr:hypothetical protein [Longimicrobiales bacterium]
MSDEQNGAREATHDLELWLVHAVEQLPGVMAAAVWLTDLGTVRAVHITAAASASGTILANATARVLRKHGLEFTPESIRVMTKDAAGAEIDVVSPDASADARSQTGPRFLLLHDFDVARSGARVTCTVRIDRGTTVFEGESIELDTEAGRARAAARATLFAAERADARLALGLEATVILDMFGRRYIAASVEAALERRFALLAGLVPVDPGRSLEEAACLAALRAIDRWIAW